MHHIMKLDAIFPYQFMVYLTVWTWGIATITVVSEPGWWIQAALSPTVYVIMSIAFLVAPPVALAGYLITDQEPGLWLNLSGDSSLAFAMFGYALGMYAIACRIDLAVLSVSILGLCMLLRAARDVVAIVILHKVPRLSTSELERVNQIVSTYKVEMAIAERQAAIQNKLVVAENSITDASDMLGDLIPLADENRDNGRLP